jgi:mannosyltransferase OCH1-like enzyme
MTIPKIIHQTMSDKNTLDDLAASNIVKLKNLNRGWEHRLYDEVERRNFIGDRYGQTMLSSYERIDPLYGAARADLFRYLALYEYGGVYLDIKSTVSRPLDEVLDEDDCYLLSNWRNKRGERYEGWGVHRNVDGVDNEYQQWHIVASPGHPFLEAVIEKVRRNIDEYNAITDGVGKNGVMKLTGPIAYTSAIKPIERLHAHRLVDIEDLGFQYSIYAPTEAHKYGHVAIFSSHYSKRVDPIVVRERKGDIQSLLVTMLTGYRLVHRVVRDSIKRLLGRPLD